MALFRYLLGLLLIINNQASLDAAITQLRKDFEDSRYLELDIKRKGRTRSGRQNRALHKYLAMLADALNEAGYDMKRTLKQDVDICWTPDLCKAYMWRPIQKAMFSIESTAKVKRADYPKIYETLNRHTAQKLGISVPWPSEGE